MLARLVMAVAAVGLFLVAYQWGNQLRFGSGEPPTIGGVLLRPAPSLPDFVLTDTLGEPFGRGDLLDHWSLLGIANLAGASGHRGMVRLVEVYNRLADRPQIHDSLRLLLVTADAAPKLARDFEGLSTAIAVLSGDRTAVADLATALGAAPDTALNGHDTEPPALFLLDPDARLVAVFPSAETPATIADDLAALAQFRKQRPHQGNDDAPH